jgi:cyclopropane fatty-acyl-phospholipid synthase-like methyltransferase
MHVSPFQVPTEFIQLGLGKRMKYSCCLFPPGKTNAWVDCVMHVCISVSVAHQE